MSLYSSAVKLTSYIFSFADTSDCKAWLMNWDAQSPNEREADVQQKMPRCSNLVESAQIWVQDFSGMLIQKN